MEGSGKKNVINSLKMRFTLIFAQIFKNSMMKKLVGIAVLGLLMAASFTSCQKCGSCEATIDGVVVTGSNSGELCGDEWEALEAAADAQKANFEAVGAEYVCTEA